MRGRLKALPTKPRENRAKRGVTRGISGWVSEPLVHLLASRSTPPRTQAHTPLSPAHPETRRSSFISRAGMNSLMTNRTISFVESSQKYVFCGSFVRPLFIPPFVLVATVVEIRGADGTGIVRLVTTIRKTALIWNPLSIFRAEWCYALIEFDIAM